MWHQWDTDKFIPGKTAPSCDYYFSHFNIAEPTSWLDVSRVFSSQTTIAVTFEWEKPSFIDF